MNEERYIHLLIENSQLKRLTAQIAALESERAELQVENHRLSKKAQEQSGHRRRVRRAKRIAQAMILLHVSGMPCTRVYMIEHGFCKQRQWERAVGLLRMARVYGQRSFVINDQARLLAGLEQAYKRALDRPESLRARMPRH